MYLIILFPIILCSTYLCLIILIYICPIILSNYPTYFHLGEARYFIEEFQNKRKGCETAKLAECQRMIEKHCSATLPDAAASADANLALLDKRVLELTKV